MFNNTVNLRIKLAYLLISEGSCDPEAWSNGCWKFSFASEFVHWLVGYMLVWPHSWATQYVCRPVTFAIEVDFLLFHIYVIHTLMLRLCRLTHSGSCGLILKNELSFGPSSGLCTWGLPPTPTLHHICCIESYLWPSVWRTCNSKYHYH